MYSRLIYKECNLWIVGSIYADQASNTLGPKRVPSSFGVSLHPGFSRA